jgi:hypothetical protein
LSAYYVCPFHPTCAFSPEIRQAEICYTDRVGTQSESSLRHDTQHMPSNGGAAYKRWFGVCTCMSLLFVHSFLCVRFLWKSC